MKVFLLIVFLVLFVVVTNAVFSLDFARLSEYGWGYLSGQAILMLLSLAGVFFTGRSIFKKIAA
ncbi:hypothetical protein [Pontibacter burrus]|uniref:DUF1049 domain-containing protein n=1 Tax=Pontibacter burrus TaxID=2704466 RepID=A0A6B3LRR9_9BACT|nr:hypothetical protein [Pontibacter burrus]NEM99542.1 hypothetical protein [Pontibacter burrus]